MANYKLVDVKSIQSSEPRSRFKESEIEEIAALFLASEILVEPLILKEEVPHTFTVLHGHKLYYGAVKAREKDPRKAEMVNAYVIDRNDRPEIEQAILEQVSKPESFDVPPLRGGDTASETRLENLETRINHQQQIFQQLERAVDQKLKELELRIPQQQSFLDEINFLEAHRLVLRLKGLGLTSAEKVSEVILAERKKGTFESLLDVVDRVRNSKGKRMISDRKMLEILQIASQTILLS